MFKNLKWLRLTPDRPGRGGWKTGLHSFPQDPINDVRVLEGAYIYEGAWRREFDPTSYPSPQMDDPQGVFPLALHGYVYPSLTNPSAQPGIVILSHHQHPGGAVVWDFTSPGGGIRQQRQPTGQPGVFQDISGRCFFGDGGTEGLILDDRTPAIHAQKNQSLGIGTPQQPLSASGGNNIVPWGTGYVHNLSPYVNNPDPNNQLGTVLATDAVFQVRVIDPNWTIIYGIPAPPFGLPTSTLANADAVTSNTTPFAAPGTMSIATGTSLVTFSNALPALYKYAGLSINFNGFSYVILTHGPLGAGTGLDLNGNAIALTNKEAIIMGIYDGPSLVNVPYTITGCQVQMKPPNDTSTATTVNTNPAATPPGVALGYSQSTASNLVLVLTECFRAPDPATGISLYRNLGNISLGPVSGGTRFTDPAAIMVFEAGQTFGAINSSLNPWIQSDVGKTIIMDKAGVGAKMLVTTIVAVVFPGNITTALPNQTGAPVTARAWWGDGIIGVEDASITAASTTLLSASNPWVLGDVGKTIMVAKAGGGGVALFTTIAAFVSAGNVTLASPNLAGNLTGLQAYWGGALSDVTAGPTYAYAWYDPETGHSSNISPMYQIPKPTDQGLFADFANLTPVFQIDAGVIAYPDQATDGIRFSHILFFRTLSTPGTSTLYPIGSLNPFVGKVHPGAVSTRGSWNPSPYHGWMGLPNNYVNAPPLTPNVSPNFWYDFSSDSDLLLSGGFRAPQETNSKPMVLLRGGATQPGFPYALQYWDRRTWIVNTQEPDVIAFSCDEAQCPLGIPTESFPPTNRLRIPAADNKVVALKTVGDMLLVTTERWAYIIAGNNESNYRLMKASSSMPGVGYYQMDEFPTYSGAEGEPSTLFYLGRDRKIYQWTLGSNVIPISKHIQDQLDTFLTAGTPAIVYMYSSIHCVSAFGRRNVIFSPFILNSVSSGIPTYIFDIDNQTWSRYQRTGGVAGELYGGTAPMTTVYGGFATPVNEMYSIFSSSFTTVLCGSWLNDTVPNATSQVQVITFPMNFDGKKTRKRLVGVNIHATAGTWTGLIRVNESIPFTVTFGAYPDPLDSIYGAGASPVDGNVQDIAVLTGQFVPPPGFEAVIGYRFIIEIRKGVPDVSPAKLYAIDVAYQDEEDIGDGEP